MGFSSYRTLLLALAGSAALLGVAALVLWLYGGLWEPSRDRFPTQGIAVSESTGAVEWRTVRAKGVDFAYARASAGAEHRDPSFATNWEGAREAGLRYGALHDFSLCRRAGAQATLFIATVPRDNAALPPVIHLAFDPACPRRPGRDAVLSELNIFLNLIESHAGKPAVLRLSEEFEEHYGLAAGINRTLWLDRDFLEPDYAGHPWVMWTASAMRRLDGAEQPVEWIVVAP
jgi:lysozyme